MEIERGVDEVHWMIRFKIFQREFFSSNFLPNTTFSNSIFKNMTVEITLKLFLEQMTSYLVLNKLS